MEKRRPTICLDFDGVVHHYRQGWPKSGDPRDIEDTPVPGVREAVDSLLGMGYAVKVHSSRCRDDSALAAIGDYLRAHDIRAEAVKHKPPSVLYVDDRGFRFNGDWGPLLDAARHGSKSLEPWNRQVVPGSTLVQEFEVPVQVVTVPGLEVQFHPEGVVVLVVTDWLREEFANLTPDQDRVAHGSTEADKDTSGSPEVRACPRCKVPAGERCQNLITGRPHSHAHRGRYSPTRAENAVHEERMKAVNEALARSLLVTPKSMHREDYTD